MGNAGEYENLWIPATLLAVLYPCFLGYLIYSMRRLPPRAAVHFNFRGVANGWMNRILYVAIMGVLGLVLSLSQVAIAFLARAGSGKMSIPHAGYWLAPERSEQTFGYLVSHGLWFACLVVVFFAGMHFLVVRANQRVPARISILCLILLTVGFVAGIFAWEHASSYHFSQFG